MEMPVYRRWPVEIAHGAGAELWASDGRRFIDFYGGHATALLGYAHPRLVGVLAEQAQQLFFQTNAVELAVRQRAVARLAAFAPQGLDAVFLVNSGAEANENALRLALRHTGRATVVAVRGGFHGRTAAAAACTDGSERWYGFPALPFPVRFIDPLDPATLEAAIDDDTAAVIVEPVQGMQGARVLSDTFLSAIRARASAVGALVIADEVQCGCGRTGEPFAATSTGLAPDLITAAKGIAGGFPCGAVIARAAVVDGLAPGDLGTTFGGGPLACALLETVIDELEKPGFLPGVAALGERIRERCQVGPVCSIEGRGLLLGLRTTPPAGDVLPRLMDAGILAGGARDPHVVRLLPPLVITRAHIEELRNALEGIAP